MPLNRQPSNLTGNKSFNHVVLPIPCAPTNTSTCWLMPLLIFSSFAVFVPSKAHATRFTNHFLKAHFQKVSFSAFIVLVEICKETKGYIFK